MNERTDTDESRALWGGNWIAVAAVVITVLGGAFTYVSTSANIEVSVQTLEKRADQQSADIRANATQLAAHDEEIAVIKTEYADIERRLEEIDQKLDDGRQR